MSACDAAPERRHRPLVPETDLLPSPRGGHHPAHRPSRPVAGPDPWPLIGRTEQLDRFRAAHADPRRVALFITGLAGVGATRLARECLANARRDVDRRSGDVLRDGDRPRARTVGRPGAQGRRILFVDDLNLLDASSLASLERLLAHGDVFLLATSRADTAPTDLARRLSAADRAVWVELADLDRDGIEDLLPLALGGPVTADTSATLWEVSRGNPLILREAVADALDRGQLTASDGVWRLSRPPVPTARLRELFAVRLSAFDTEALAVLERLALEETVGLATLTATTPMDVLERLERQGLIRVDQDGRRRPVRLAYPFYGAMIRDRLPRLTQDRLRRDRLRHVGELGARRRDDLVRGALWHVDTAARPDVDLLIRAAWLSRHAMDFAGVERLARAALDAGGHAEHAVTAAALLGDALSQLGRPREADEVLAAATHRAAGAARGRDGAAPGSGDEPTAALRAQRALNLSWGSSDPERALAVLARPAPAGARATQARDAGTARELAAVGGLVLTLGGRPGEAFDLLAGPARPVTDDGTSRWIGSGQLPAPAGPLEATAQAITLGALGRGAEALAVAALSPTSAAGPGRDRERAGGDDVAALPGLHPVLHGYGRALVRYDAGRFDDAIAQALEGLRRSVADRLVTGHSGYTLLLGRAHLAAGRPRTSIRWLRETAAVAVAQGLADHLQLARCALAVAHAYLGDEEAGRRAVVAASGSAGAGDDAARRSGLAAQAWAWNEALAGRRAEAVGALSTAADELAAAGQLVQSAALLHDMARLGSGAAALPRLSALCAATDRPLIKAAHAFALGADRRDAETLADAASAFESLGAQLYAAEAVAEARRCHPWERGRNALGARAVALAARCEGARTPPLLGGDAVPALSARERQIAALAARGLSGSEIADRLVLSVRTVNNHLQRAYRKLGITGRTQLPAALGTPAPIRTARADLL